MNLVALVFTVCALANPQACRVTHVMLDANGSLMSCMVGAQSYLAQWEQSHPAMQVRRWKCEWPGREKEQI